MFNSKEIQDSGSKFINGGCVTKAKVLRIEGNGEGSAPYIVISQEEIGTGRTAENRFYLPLGDDDDTKKRRVRELGKLKHLAKAMVSEKEFTDADDASNNIEQFGANLNKLLSGKACRIKFGSREIKGKDGKNNWMKASIGLPPFAESLEVSDEASILKITPKDIYRLTTPTEVEVIDDMPF